MTAKSLLDGLPSWVPALVVVVLVIAGFFLAWFLAGVSVAFVYFGTVAFLYSLRRGNPWSLLAALSAGYAWLLDRPEGARHWLGLVCVIGGVIVVVGLFFEGGRTFWGELEDSWRRRGALARQRRQERAIRARQHRAAFAQLLRPLVRALLPR